MSQYADSSFLVSCYVLDANTPAANAYLLNHRTPLIFTSLHALEVRNAFQLGVFRGLFSAADAAAARANLETDLRSGRLVRKNVNWPNVLRFAGRLSERYSKTVGTRSLDVLHVAVARALRVGELVSFDARQRALAVNAGFKVAP